MAVGVLVATVGIVAVGVYALVGIGVSVCGMLRVGVFVGVDVFVAVFVGVAVLVACRGAVSFVGDAVSVGNGVIGASATRIVVVSLTACPLPFAP